jgi:hypothetical protein
MFRLMARARARADENNCASRKRWWYRSDAVFAWMASSQKKKPGKSFRWMRRVAR